MKKVIIDVFGADTPDSLIKGAARATLENEDVKILLPGVPQVIEDVLCECEYDPRRIEILPAEQVITNDDDPVNAVFQKRRSSVVTAAKYFAENDDCIGFASAGNTGALLAASTAYVGRLDGIERPSLCTFLPSSKDRFVCMLDCGANVDCKPQQMIQFALMGSALVECCVGVKDPTVAIVSNGTESRKGNSFTREVYSLLEKMPINFVGNM